MLHLFYTQMIWQPYTLDVLAQLPDYCFDGQDIWRSRVPLICFHIVERQFPDRVLCQFEIEQPVPNDCDTDARLHRIDLKERVDQDWHSHISISLIYGRAVETTL